MVSDRPQVAASPDGGDVAAAAKAGEPDRYLAALLASLPQREALLALAAFAAELARIPFLVVREPQMGEIRLQWWSDALGLPEGQRAGQGVADAVRQAARTYELPAGLLDGLIEGRALQLRGGAFADEQTLDDFLWKTEGALFALASRVVGIAPSAEVEAACRMSGQAYGLARLLLALPRSLALGRVPLAQTELARAGVTAQDLLAGAGGAGVAALLGAYHARIRVSLASARRFVGGLPRTIRVAFLPLALVGPYVRALERAGGMASREEARLSPLMRVCRIGAAHLSGRL